MGSTAFAQIVPPIFDNDSLPLSQFIDGYVERHKETTAAMSAVVFTKEDVLLEAFYGYANLADKTSNDADTVMEWGSVTKLLVWVSVMQLVEQGKLDLDADIRAYLPEGFLSKLQYDDPITLLHLMNHNAGWQEMYLGAESVMEGAVPSLEEALKVIEPPQIYKPGEITAYSNYGANLAGYIVERAAGKPFYEYVRENIFVVLGMDETALQPGWHDNDWVKTQRDKLRCYTTDMQDLGKAYAIYELYASGNAAGTIADLRKFAQALLPGENGASPLFKESGTLGEMLTQTDYYADGRTARNYHGLWADPSLVGNVIGHGGNTAGCSAWLMLDLERGIGMVILTNQAGESTYCNDMVRGIAGEKGFSAAPVDNDPVVGYYVYARTARKGMAKSLGSPYVLGVAQSKDGTLAIRGLFSLLMGGGDMERVGEGLYRLDADGQKMLLYADADESGRIQLLESATSDFFRTGAGEYYGNTTVLVAFVLAVIYALVFLILMLVRTLRKKKQPLAFARAAVCAGIIAAFVNWLILFMNGMSLTGTVTGVKIQGILFIFLALIPVVYAAVTAICRKKLTITRKQKAGLMSTAAAGLIMTLCIIYWQLWMFWV
ncbi:MAG: beta-lactamase family protein [Firmicutes bacterium]|nr:beta-lactamase family protein [Bacillota bacterium]